MEYEAELNKSSSRNYVENKLVKIDESNLFKKKEQTVGSSQSVVTLSKNLEELVKSRIKLEELQKFKNKENVSFFLQQKKFSKYRNPDIDSRSQSISPCIRNLDEIKNVNSMKYDPSPEGI